MREEETMSKAVIYLRVSTKEQAETGGQKEGYSIPAQREACRRKAESIESVVVEEFVDRGESAKTASRQGLQALLTYLATEHVDYVIVHKIDRLARNRADDVQINLTIQESGARLVSCTESIDDTPSGILVHGIMSSIAEFYSRNLANEVMKGSVQKAKSGGLPGKAPCGYRNIRTVENGRDVRTVEIDPDRGPLMTWAFEEYATGQWTIRTLRDALTDKGLTTLNGPRTPSKPIGTSHLHRLLKHPFYKGVVKYRGVEYAGTHTPLVDEQIWDRVQAILDSKSRSGEKQRQHHHYLKGSLYCANCASRLIVTIATNRYHKEYRYFVCLGRHQRRTTCEQKAVLISKVESGVEEHYADLEPGQNLIGALKATIHEEMDSLQKISGHETRIQHRRIAVLRSERAKLLQAHYADAVPIDMLKTEQDRISQELSRAENRIGTLDIEHDTITRNLDTALDFASRWAQAYRASGSAIRRRFNQAIFRKLCVDGDGNVTSELQEPLEMLLNKPDRKKSEVPSVVDDMDQAWEKMIDIAEVQSESNNSGVDTALATKTGEGLKYERLVGERGLEPPRAYRPLGPEPSASTNSATRPSGSARDGNKTASCVAIEGGEIGHRTGTIRRIWPSNVAMSISPSASTPMALI